MAPIRLARVPRDGEVFDIASHAPDERQRDAVLQLQAFRTPATEGRAASSA